MIDKLKASLILKGYNDFKIENNILINPLPNISVRGCKKYNQELLIVALYKHGFNSVIESMYNNKIVLCL
jgi:hypothetical protein